MLRLAFPWRRRWWQDYIQIVGIRMVGSQNPAARIQHLPCELVRLDILPLCSQRVSQIRDGRESLRMMGPQDPQARFEDFTVQLFSLSVELFVKQNISQIVHGA